MNENTLLGLMAMLDAGRTQAGPLNPHIRARLFAVVASPDQGTWEAAHSIIICAPVTLWQAVLEHTFYAATSKPSDGRWPCVPTHGQLLKALRATLLMQSP